MADEYPDDYNRKLFDSSAVVADYSALEGLTPCEQAVFGRHIRPGSDVLDLGVGAGRTVEPLRSPARRYVGVDYAPHMIEACRARFPSVEFHVADAADLSRFDDRSFDATVFSFNGIDCLYPDQARRSCLGEVARVLRDDGVFVFSVHNPIGVITAPNVAGLPRRVALRRYAKEAYLAARRLLNAIRGPLWRGEGYVLDPVHGGLVTHLASRRAVRRELAEHGFTHLETLPSLYPMRRPGLFVIWYYYAFRVGSRRSSRSR